MTALGLGLVPVLGITLFVVTQIVLSREHHLLRRELLEESASGLLPAAHADVIPFYFKRQRSAWLAGYEHVDRKAYVRAATLLAFRRSQARLTPQNAQIAGDLERLRGQVRDLLAPNRWEA